MACQICGKYSGYYPLCKECFKLRDEGEIEQCPDCKAWHYINKPCNCEEDDNDISYIFEKEDKKSSKNKEKATQDDDYPFEREDKKSSKQKTEKQNNSIEIENIISETTEENNVVIINEQNKSKCITCGKKTDGLLFCSTCFHKYKDKELLFKITNCSNVELLDENYEGRYTCKDGHIVKSKSEREIDNYLFEHGISHAYEKALPYGASEKEILHPDFFLPNYLDEGKHVYIEHWGYNENNIQYTKTKKFKLPIYENLGITLICTYEKTDTADIDTTLDRKLRKDFIEEGKINFSDETTSKTEDKTEKTSKKRKFFSW